MISHIRALKDMKRVGEVQAAQGKFKRFFNTQHDRDQVMKLQAQMKTAFDMFTVSNLWYDISLC